MFGLNFLVDAEFHHEKLANRRYLIQKFHHQHLMRFEADQVIRDALGDGLSSEFLTLKRAEWIEYMRHVSDWEIKRYLEFF